MGTYAAHGESTLGGDAVHGEEHATCSTEGGDVRSRPEERRAVKTEEPRPHRQDGRVIRARLGANPNSSGHGILWGALFFLPMATAGVVLAGILEKSLDKALAEHAAGSAGGGKQ